jgi:CRP-like cAMP-binding protein
MPGLQAPSIARHEFPGLIGRINPAAIQSPKTYLRSISTAAETGPLGDPAVRRLFAAHPVLGTLPDQERDALLQWSRIRILGRQEMICRQDEAASSVILVLEGHLKLSSLVADGTEVFLDIAGPGQCIGELAALQKQLHTADATALSPCRVLLIDSRQFRLAFEHRSDGLLAILRLAGERLRRVSEQLADTCTLAAPVRLAKVLLRLARLPSSGSNSVAGLPLRLSQSELGLMTGLCREVVNKQLRIWLADGWIGMCAGRVTSVEIAALGRLVGDTEGDSGGRRVCG